MCFGYNKRGGLEKAGFNSLALKRTRKRLLREGLSTCSEQQGKRDLMGERNSLERHGGRRRKGNKAIAPGFLEETQRSALGCRVEVKLAGGALKKSFSGL